MMPMPEKWRSILDDPPPFGCDLELAVIDHQGMHRFLCPCCRTTGGWVKRETKEHVDMRPTHWRHAHI